MSVKPYVRAACVIALMVVWLYYPMLPDAQAAGLPSKLKGMTITNWGNTGFNTTGGKQSFTNMLADLPNCIAIVVTWYQDNINTTTIYRTSNTETDSDLIFAIQEAHSAGKCVMLKPHLDLKSDSSHWRGQIGTNFSSSQWTSWFSSYQSMINHYAQMASNNGVELLCIGTELSTAATKQPSGWRTTIAGIRSRYKGALTYGANHDGEEQNITWWDAVDYIGVSAYYTLTNHSNPTVAELVSAWAPKVTMLQKLSAKWGKSILFTEIGYRSVAGTNTKPWDSFFSAPLSMSEQSNCYQALFQSFWGQTWFKGVFWWYWNISPSVGGTNDGSYTVYKKPAETTLKSWYSK